MREPGAAEERAPDPAAAAAAERHRRHRSGGATAGSGGTGGTTGGSGGSVTSDAATEKSTTRGRHLPPMRGTSTPPPAGERASAACGKGGPVPAEGLHTLKVGAMNRRFFLRLPAGYDGKTPAPVIFGFHGAGNKDAAWFDTNTGLRRENEDKAVLVFGESLFRPGSTTRAQLAGRGPAARQPGLHRRDRGLAARQRLRRQPPPVRRRPELGRVLLADAGLPPRRRVPGGRLVRRRRAAVQQLQGPPRRVHPLPSGQRERGRRLASGRATSGSSTTAAAPAPCPPAPRPAWPTAAAPRTRTCGSASTAARTTGRLTWTGACGTSSRQFK